MTALNDHIDHDLPISRPHATCGHRQLTSTPVVTARSKLPVISGRSPTLQNFESLLTAAGIRTPISMVHLSRQLAAILPPMAAGIGTEHDISMLAELPTPALLLDATVIARNIQRLTNYAATPSLGRSCRPYHQEDASLASGQNATEFRGGWPHGRETGEADGMRWCGGSSWLRIRHWILWRVGRFAPLAERAPPLHVAVDLPEAVRHWHWPQRPSAA